MERRTTAELSRIQRLRRWARAQGLVLRASRRQTPGALDYDRWHLGPKPPRRPSGAEYRLTLAEVEDRLTAGDTAPHTAA